MSNVARVAGQAANTLTKPLEVEDVFSTYLYTGNGSTQTITNGIDLDGEGGLVWIKSRSYSYPHNLYDTERGATKRLKSASTVAESTLSTGLTAFSSTGFTLGGDNDTNGTFSDAQYASWTFRKAPKFFDIVTYTGDGVDNRTIAHNLGSVPGMIIVKPTSASGQWPVYHRSLGTGAVRLNLTNAYNSANIWWKTTPTDSAFTVYGGGEVNVSGVEYVAYLFAHNDGDGEFGPDGDADIIKCGSYTGNGSTTGPVVDLGFEPQWVLIKETSATGNWQLFDSMRGMVAGGVDARIAPNLSSAEDSIQSLTPTATGFQINTTSGNINTNNSNHIYIAIRRGTAVPTSATDVFAVTTQSGSTPPAHDTGFVTDFSLRRENALSSASVIQAADRLRGKPYLTTEGTNSETNLNNNTWDFMDGWFGATSNDSNKYAWSWKRAPKYFDVVAYTGDGVSTVVKHNLGVAPEMIHIKSRSDTINWASFTFTDSTSYWQNDLDRDFGGSFATNFSGSLLGVSKSDITLAGSSDTSSASETYIAYLFATLAGISKVGSYTGNGTSQTIDCGFSSGARFILVKRTDSTGDWYVWDTERGIVAGNDPYLELNTTDAEVTSTDWVDPDNSGFIVNGTTINASSASYIFYAIA